MKKKFILTPLIGALLYVVLSSYNTGPAHTAGLELTGATGTTGCGGCHNPSASPSTNVTVTLLSSGVPVTTYTPGATYTIQISGQNTSSNILPAFGFQVSVVKVSGGVTSDAGSMTSAPTGTGVIPLSIGGGTVTVWEHYNGGSVATIPATTLVGGGGSGTTYVESITWTAPSAGTGCITIYGVINAVNDDGIDDVADLWNNTSSVINESVAGITGTATVCTGATTTLSDATPCGVWSSSTTTVATVSGGVVTGVIAGTATISYTAGTGNTATKVVTVNGAPPNITGTASVCKGSTTPLSDASFPGTWTSSNTGVATVVLITGTVSGVAAGTSTITYTAATGCTTTKVVTVNPLPSAITGTANVCIGSTTALTDAGGGTWTSSNTTVATVVTGTGVVTGAAAGTSTIVYTLPTGCTANTTVTVNPLPSGITGTTTVCPGYTTSLTDAGGGTWSSSNTSIATVITGTGVATGVSGGTATITYFLPVTGCTAATTVTVYPLPPSITGSTTLCAGATTTLSDATSSGTWTSGNTSIATIGAGSGIVTGAAGPGGTATITYTVPVTGCTTTTPVTINPLPAGITGATSVCPSTTTPLTDATSGGNWTSSNTSVADIDFFSGFVTNGIAGTATITYTLGTGCTAATTVTVNPSPPAITGTTSVCSGSTTNLSDATTGGTWTSANSGIATIGSSSGLVTGVGTSGVAHITYSAPGTGCTANTTVTVNLLPGAIGGTPTVCSGATTLLNDAGGGTWSSSNTSVATVSAGLVTGIGTGGTATITYTLPTTGCIATKTVTVNPLPAGITGTESVCTGSTTSLTDVTTGGTWTSGTTTAATVGASTGIVTGLGAGNTTSVITYALGTGCKTTATVTINPLPSAITGTAVECVGSTVTLGGPTGGAWSSSNTAVATVGSGTGGVTGISAGTATISYILTTTGCASVKNVTINTSPSAISGTASVCAGLTTALSDGGGGTWSSSTTTVATVAGGTGLVTGVAGGTSTITYALPVTGCTATKAVTVNPLGPVTGLTTLCLGLTTTLSDAATGGTWASSNTSVATIGSGSGFVNSVSAGTTVINYTLPTGCLATVTVTIVSSPSGITGNTNICLGQTSALSDGGGGTWTSSNTTVATVGFTTGVVTGVSLSTATITYSLGTGCTATTGVTVNPVPSGISGTASVCEGGTTALTDVTASGTWSSSNTNATVGSTGIVTGVAAGTATISYTLASGCSAFKTVTINPLPSSISGTTGVCLGSSATLSDAGGGTWTSSNTGVATIGLSTGTVTSLSAGTSTIVYTLPVTGCKANATVTVNALPSSITGAGSVCAGATTALTDAGGGSWSNSNTNVTVGSATGIVTGITTGTSTISYTLSTGCFITKTITVDPLPAGITGTASVCAGNATILSDVTTGGSWSSSATAIAGVGSSTGVVIGLSAGTATIAFTISLTGCSTATTVTVNPLPSAISGTFTLCAASSTALSDTASGGAWTSSNTTVATVGALTGTLSGISGGTAVITYTLGTGCFSTATVTVDPLPSSITGSGGVCIGATTTLSDGGGGTWSSSNTSVATITPVTGIVTGISASTAVITYTLATGCEAHFLITVDPLPSVITGTAILCAGSTTALSDTASGGTWSSSNTAVAVVGSSTGVVTGIVGGTPTITYTLSTGCMSVISVTVEPLPSSITGTDHVCIGLTTSLSDASTGGAWSSSNTGVATIGSGSGIVTGVSSGTSVIAYTLATGCASSVTVTVDPLPLGITGTAHVCVAATTALSDVTTGGSWNSSNTAVATVSGTGVVAGVSAGTVTITYTLTTGCNTIISVTVNPLASASTITGTGITCLGTAGILSDAASGGVWGSSNTAVATVSGGIVTGVSVGIATISYSVTNGCGTAHTSLADTVIDIPTVGAISGTDSVCAGDSIVVGDTATGGIWTSSSANATVSPTGAITGVTAGTAIISYSKTTVCGTATATLSLTINPVTSCNTGVKIIQDNAEFRVYPNPSQGSFIVEMPATGNGATICIIDILGKVVDTRVITDPVKQKVSFDLRNIAPGSYIVKVNAGDNIYRQKITIW